MFAQALGSAVKAQNAKNSPVDAELGYFSKALSALLQR